jgi:3-oxoacyl-[acyl-carrier protein] reductase
MWRKIRGSRPGLSICHPSGVFSVVHRPHVVLDDSIIAAGSKNETRRKAIALRFAAEGARVVINDLSEGAVESVHGAVKKARGKALEAPGDVTSRKQMEPIFERVAAKWGGIDILVFAAGVRVDATIQNLSAEQWDEVMQVHLKGSFVCSQLAQKHMVQQGHGRMVLVGSPIPAGLGSPGQANYCTANAGLVGLTTSLAIELGPHDITVNCIAPDFIDTKMTREAARRDGLFMDDFKRAVLAKIPLRRLGSADDVAAVALFLASDEAGYVSGQVINVRGGP